jgi:hypothetical protein
MSEERMNDLMVDAAKLFRTLRIFVEHVPIQEHESIWEHSRIPLVEDISRLIHALPPPAGPTVDPCRGGPILKYIDQKTWSFIDPFK